MKHRKHRPFSILLTALCAWIALAPLAQANPHPHGPHSGSGNHSSPGGDLSPGLTPAEAAANAAEAQAAADAQAMAEAMEREAAARDLLESDRDLVDRILEAIVESPTETDTEADTTPAPPTLADIETTDVSDYDTTRLPVLVNDDTVQVYELGDESLLIVPTDPGYSPEERAELDAEETRNFEHHLAILDQDLEYDDHAMLPELEAVVRDEDDHIVAREVERVPGTRFRDAVLTPEQRQEVLRQVEEQMTLLHDAGLYHGDMHPGNIMVEVGEDGDVHVRFIDPLYHSTMEDGQRADERRLERMQDPAPPPPMDYFGEY